MQSDLVHTKEYSTTVGSKTKETTYQMQVPFLIGRIIVGVLYLYSGLDNVINLSAKAGYAASKGVPMPQLAVLFTGLLLLVGGLSILTGFQVRIGVAALVLFFLPVTFMMHNFWAIQDPMMRMAEMHNFQSNILLTGSALMFLAINTPWPLSLGAKSSN
jgi:putative oxidoreductase